MIFKNKNVTLQVIEKNMADSETPTSHTLACAQSNCFFFAEL